MRGINYEVVKERLDSIAGVRGLHIPSNSGRMVAAVHADAVIATFGTAGLSETCGAATLFIDSAVSRVVRVRLNSIMDSCGLEYASIESSGGKWSICCGEFYFPIVNRRGLVRLPVRGTASAGSIDGRGFFGDEAIEIARGTGAINYQDCTGAIVSEHNKWLTADSAPYLVKAWYTVVPR